MPINARNSELGPPIGLSPGSAIRKKEAADGNRRQYDMRGARVPRVFRGLEEHRLPGMGVRVSGSTMVITAWYAELGDEAGVILLNLLGAGRPLRRRRGVRGEASGTGLL